MRLKARTHCREESLAELEEDVEQLLHLAYPEADEAMGKVLAQDQFIDTLLDDMRLPIRQNKPATLKVAFWMALQAGEEVLGQSSVFLQTTVQISGSVHFEGGRGERKSAPENTLSPVTKEAKDR